MSGLYYGREYRLVLARSVKDKYFETRDEQTITGLRVTFTIDRALHHAPNTAAIAAYNLSEASRAFVADVPVAVKLYAGYEGEASLLFSGDVRFAPSSFEGPNIVTRIEAGDGRRAYKHARLHKSYAPGVDARQVLKDAAGAMNLHVPTSAVEAKEMLEQFAGGYTLSGPTADELTRLLKPRGMSWSIQGGRLQVLRGDEARPGTAFVIEEETGMLGSPLYSPPKKKGGKHTLAFRTVLRPELEPGARLDVRARAVSGAFRVETAKHVGDSEGEDWYTDVEVKAL